MSAREARHPFVATTLFIAGALLIWLGAFTLSYVFAALACAKKFADVELLGLPIVAVIATFACVVAAIGSGFLLYRGNSVLKRSADDHERFLGFVAVATSAVTIIALVMLVLPPLMVSACARP